MLASIDVDRDHAGCWLAMLDGNYDAGAQTDLPEEAQQFGNVVLDLEDVRRNADWQIGQIDRVIVLPQLAIWTRNRMTMRTGLRVTKEARQMRLDGGRDGVLDATCLDARMLPGQAEMIHEQPLCKPLPAQRHRTDTRTFRRGDDTKASFMHDVPVRVELLQH